MPRASEAAIVWRHTATGGADATASRTGRKFKQGLQVSRDKAAASGKTSLALGATLKIPGRRHLGETLPNGKAAIRQFVAIIVGPELEMELWTILKLEAAAFSFASQVLE